jgi:hypothetical protein
MKTAENHLCEVLAVVNANPRCGIELVKLRDAEVRREALEEQAKEIDRLVAIVKECNSDWCRLRDFIRGESPEEMMRLQNAFTAGRGVQGFQAYVASLWYALRNKKDPTK